MYTATMIYEFKEEHFEEASNLWKTDIFDLAKEQPGFIRMQLLVDSPKMMAIGTWKDKSFANDFMKKTLVFKNYKNKVAEWLTKTQNQ